MSNIQVINKDFRECEIPKGLVITDPPYNQGYHYDTYDDNLKEEAYIQLLSKIPIPCVIIHYPEDTINFLPKAFNMKVTKSATWVFNSNTERQSRTISWWGCAPDFKKVRQEYKNLKDKRIQARIAEGKTGARSYDWFFVNQVKNVSKEKTEHPCQIPEEIMRRIILMTAKPGQIIIDPFAGSGTTLKAAKDLGYDAIGYEIDEKYVEIINNRLKDEVKENGVVEDTILR